MIAKLFLSFLFFWLFTLHQTTTCAFRIPLFSNNQTKAKTKQQDKQQFNKYDDKQEASTAITTTMPPSSLKFNIQCQCGKVKAAIQCLDTAPPLRLVCYCKDCRGYYQTLNRMAETNRQTPAAKLDPWGGVDWTCLYPRDITITQGKDSMVTTKIRETSPIRQVYTSCCHTPMFRFGSNSVLLNTHCIDAQLLNDNNDGSLDVRFRIIGRQALQKLADDHHHHDDAPSMSWSVPLSWLWVMGRRIKQDLMTPMPFDLDPVDQVPAMKDFQEGEETMPPPPPPI